MPVVDAAAPSDWQPRRCILLSPQNAPSSLGECLVLSVWLRSTANLSKVMQQLARPPSDPCRTTTAVRWPDCSTACAKGCLSFLHQTGQSAPCGWTPLVQPLGALADATQLARARSPNRQLPCQIPRCRPRASPPHCLAGYPLPERTRRSRVLGHPHRLRGSSD